jgi:O-antigen/teichoic acid export membrane protein
LLKNIGSNWLLLIISILSAYLLLPFNLHALGAEQYGVWLVITSLTGYLTLLQLGVPMASVRFLTQAIERGDNHQTNVVVASCAGLYFFLGAVCVALGVGLLLFFEAVYATPVGFRWDARYAFVIVLLNIGAGFVSQVPAAILTAHREFIKKNSILMFSVILRTALNIVLIRERPTIIVLAVVLISSTLFELIVSSWICQVSYKQIALKLDMFDKRTVKSIFGFSVFVLLLNLGTQLSFQTDALVIGKFMSTEKVPIFAVASMLLVYLMQFIIGIAAVVMPTATALQAKNDQEQLKMLFLKWSKVSVAITCCAASFLFVFGPAVIGIWVGKGFEAEAGGILRILLLSYVLFLPTRGVALPLLTGLGKAKQPTIAFAVAGVANLVLSIALVQRFGLNGVAWGTTIPNILLALWLLKLVCKELQVGFMRTAGDLFLRPVAGLTALVVTLEYLSLTHPPETLLSMLIFGVLSVLMFGAVWTVVLYKDPELDLQKFIFAHLRIG